MRTGLDLVLFSDIIFYELTTNLSTLWQAMPRVWRLGQAQSVTTTFLVYAGTTEAASLAWMGAKMKAGMVMYGDNAAGALVDETDEDEDDLRREMIRHALQGKSYEALGRWSRCSPIHSSVRSSSDDQSKQCADADLDTADAL